MDLHSPQIQGFFDVPVDNLYAAPVLNDFVESLGHDAPTKRIVVSPDVGSIKRAIGHAKRLGAGLAIVDKRRDNPTETRQEHIIGGPVEGMVAIMFDDMVTTGGSIAGAAAKLKELRRHGNLRRRHARRPLRQGDRKDQRLADHPARRHRLDSRLARKDASPKIKVLSVAPLLAEAIKRIHHDQSISILFDKSEPT